MIEVRVMPTRGLWALGLYCRRWGGDLVVLDKSKFAKLFMCSEPYYHNMHTFRDNDQFDAAPATECPRDGARVRHD